MSLSNTTVKAKYAGNDVTTSFAIPFDIILDDSEVKVILRDETDPDNITETLQVDGVDYNLTGSSPPSIPFSTTVEMVTAPSSTQELLVYRDMPLTQLLDYLETSQFRAEDQESGLDKLTAIVQEIAEKLTRAALLSRATDANLPITYPEPKANNFVGWDDEGDDLRNYTASEIVEEVVGLVLLKANNLSDVASASASRTNIGVGDADDVTHNSLTLVANLSAGGSVTGAGVISSADVKFETFVNGAQIATPSNPAAGRLKLYFKADGNLYKLDEFGVETVVGGGGAAADLGNLIATEINQNLRPDADGTRSVGELARRWLEMYSATYFAPAASGAGAFKVTDLAGSVAAEMSGNQTMPSGTTSSSVFKGGPANAGSVGVHSVNDATADANPTKDVRIETGNKTAGTGDSGSLIMQTGTSAGGIRGIFQVLARFFQLPSFASAPSSPAAGALYYDSTLGKFRGYTSQWGDLGGGGGGGALKWVEATSSPVPNTEFEQEIYLYEAGISQDLYAAVRVPASYTSGSPVTLKLPLYSPDVTGTVLMRAESTLLEPGSSAVDSTTNQHTSTNTAVSLSATANRVEAIEIDLTDSSGQINSVAVAAGDIIKVRLYRDTDTATSDVRALVYGTEVTFS